MTTQERLELIDQAIDSVLSNLQNGIEIKEYQIDNLKISKRSPFELIGELRKMKKEIKKDAFKKKVNHVQYFF
ncbi:hypothetical protein [Campylobacter hyointestinalis]|uniref:hypothetical protein n=1 Tax=Campylobacter hyointestinalis TaxID=198 RepID=UPI000CE364C3|nr:hypothetical protein [Campylobacter hyointestinalis]PPB63105.1 hypothetical protein CDQ72_01530 [Campylobacter hyointestinalis subsp. hyointestinalis]PPB65375.1 hypothetical protein CDQ73_01280 [Campylobacter hyointestinalis subsp. hyointestinalis]